MTTATIHRWLVPVAGIALLTAACAGGSEDTTTTAAPSTSAPASTMAPTTTSGEDPLVAARRSVIRIVAEGSFVDPEYGEQLNAAGSGSGFIISEDGVAVTNNHVVTGAAFVEVYVNGETEPRNARIVGASECWDLAVIDIDGDGFDPLQWSDADATAGLPIFALGFPLGDAEYTVLDGVISKSSADGESNWASVDSVIEHSADTLPGNSGGPIVDEDGRVVAINYAGNAQGQAFAIAADLGRNVVDRLQDGEDFESLGINGEAVLSPDGSFSGVWVSSVKSGSPADIAGVEGGDLMTKLEGLVLATDGSMADYCDILRSHRADDPLAVEVYRPSVDAFLKGTLNQEGGELTPPQVIVTGPEGGDADGGGGGADVYPNFVTITDDSGTISVDVPAEWTDVLGATWFNENIELGPGLSASTDREAWLNTWEVPGVFVGASEALLAEYGSAEAYLADFAGFSDCQDEATGDYDDGLYVGVYSIYEGCGDTGATFARVIAVPTETADYLIRFEFQAIADRDFDALDVALSTFIAISG